MVKPKPQGRQKGRAHIYSTCRLSHLFAWWVRPWQPRSSSSGQGHRGSGLVTWSAAPAAAQQTPPWGNWFPALLPPSLLWKKKTQKERTPINMWIRMQVESPHWMLRQEWINPFTLTVRVINVKCPLQPHQKYNVTQHEELGFSYLTQMKTW